MQLAPQDLPEPPATTVLDLPYDFMPLHLVARLATLNRGAHAAAAKDIATRDYAWELYEYLKTLDTEEVHPKVYQELPDGLVWDVLEAVYRRVGEKGAHVLVMPPDGPITVHAHAVQASTGGLAVTQRITLDVQETIPAVYEPADGLAGTAREVVDILGHHIARHVQTYVGGDAGTWTTDWFTTVPPMVIVNFRSRKVHLTPALYMDSYIRPEGVYMYDAGIGTIYCVKHALTQVVALGF